MMQSRFYTVILTGLLGIAFVSLILFLKKSDDTNRLLNVELVPVNNIAPKAYNQYSQASHYIFYKMCKEETTRSFNAPIIKSVREHFHKMNAIQDKCEMAKSYKYNADSCSVLSTEIKEDKKKIAATIGGDKKELWQKAFDEIEFNLKGNENPILIEAEINRFLLELTMLSYDYVKDRSSEIGSADLKFGNQAESSTHGLPIGKLAYNPPKSMRLDKKERVWIKISQNILEDMKLSSTPNVVTDSIKVSPIMSVKLTGEGFEVIALDDSEQGVTEDGYTQWDFDVIPKETGNHNLYLKIAAVYNVPGLGTTKKYLPVYDRVIEVKTEPLEVVGNFIVTNWEFFISTFIIPFLIWKYTEFRRGRRRKNNKEVK